MNPSLNISNYDPFGDEGTITPDGFVLSLRVRGISNWETLALHEMEFVRRASDYKPYWMLAPANATETGTLAAYSQLEVELFAPPESVLYGFLGGYQGSVITMQISEASVKEGLYNDFVYQHGTTVTVPGLYLLPYPLVVTEPGLMSIEFYNSAASPVNLANMQIILLFAVPIAACGMLGSGGFK